MNKRGWTQEQAKHRSYVDAASGWQIIAYSSETDMAAEGAWVAAEVAKHTGTCRIVIAHKGRHVVADTAHGDNTSQESVWSAITGKTAINLVGHNHIYGRLAPDRRRDRFRVRRGRPRRSLARLASITRGGFEDGRRHSHPAGAAPGRRRLQPGRQERHGLRLRHHHLRALGASAGTDPRCLGRRWRRPRQ